MSQGWMEERLADRTERIQGLIASFARFGEMQNGGVTRPSFSDADIAARRYLREIMADLGLTVSTDPAGNLFGRRPGQSENLGALMVGSHLDTVPNGGRYDGALGIIGALEIVRELVDSERMTRHPIEVVMFTAEEANEFGLSTFGSRACAGRLSQDRVRSARAHNLSIEEALQRVGGDLGRLDECVFPSGRAAAFLELHIEQGVRLEDDGIQIGVVTGIAGIHRLRVVVEGEAGHAGAVPMHRRRDALAGAAEVVQAVERLAKEATSDEVVATVGVLRVDPGGANVIPGRVEFLIEMRAGDAAELPRLADHVRSEASAIANARDLNLTVDPQLEQGPELMSAAVVEALENSAGDLGVDHRRLFSMAGHDATHLATLAPSGMVFVPSHGGKSHCPEEYTKPADASVAVEVMLRALLRLDKQLD